MGTAIHSQFERNLYAAANKNPKLGLVVEKKMWESVLDRKIVGKLDIYLPGVIFDLKTTSVWKYILGGVQEYSDQLNLYSFFVRKLGLSVNQLKVILFFTDWNERDTVKDNYPKDRIIEIKMDEIWKPEEAETRVKALVQNHINCEKLPDDQLPDCTSEEVWEQPTKFAVKWEGGKKALKVFEDKKEAEKFRVSKEDSDGNNPIIEVRPGKRTRCEDFCDLHEWCSQWKAMEAEHVQAQTEDDET